MKNTNLYLSSDDHRLLSHLLIGLSGKNAANDRLRGELARAVILESSAVPPTSVGLNSRVRFQDLDTNEQEEYVLTLPAIADSERQRISILAPIGTALLGYSEGDEIEWPTPGGIRRLKLLHVTRDDSPVGVR
jgi:regulator of nucleoside diphosphate kinase